MTTPATATIGLGSNLGDRRQNLMAAKNALAQSEGVLSFRMSSIIETAPVGITDQPTFFNAAALIRTTLDPHALLDLMLQVERELGRDRSREQRWGPRTIDLDLLTYADATIRDATLTIPHPRMHERAFVLGPLAELAPDLRPPGCPGNIAQMLAAVNAQDHAEIRR